MIPSAITRNLPTEFQIVLADVGSAGGLHRRWSPIRDNVTAILFDPLDESTGSGRDRYFPVALAKDAGNVALHVTKRVSMTSTLLPNNGLLGRFWDKPDHTTVVSTSEIPTDSLDHVMETAGITLDVIKIDVQGGEYGILEGGRSALTSSLFLAEIEVSFLERYLGLRTFDEVVAFMRSCDFDLIDIGRIKRYRYSNSFGIVNPGLGMGDRAGRLAFCDALFMLRDEVLLDRIASRQAENGSDLALKAILSLLVHGKADIAARLFDVAADQIDPPVAERLSRWFRQLRGRHFGRKGLHKALDYFSRKV